MLKNGMDPILAAADEAELLDRTLSGARPQAQVSYLALAEHHAETTAKYRNLVEQLPCVVYLAEYGPDGEWLYVSPQIERILGYAPKDWLEHPHPQATFTHPDDLPRVRAAEERSMANVQPLKIEYRMRRADGAWVWLLDEATAVLGEDGRPICLQGLMFDITERREEEERLIALDRLKNTLLHTLSHDLKEPLTAILVAASTLDRLGDELDEEERKHLLHTLIGRSKGMNVLLTDLLDLDRLDSGIVTPRRYPVDLVSLVRDLVGQTDVLAGRTVEIEDGTCRANVDPRKVERIVENLLSNAVRHTPLRSRIWVRCWREGGAAVIAVEDDGPGVEAEFEEAIFEAFHRGPNTGGTPGSGIGLSLVARFAELHGGRAWVQQREGGGASFRVLLPDGDE
jgi:PAS domain S-box-containing protein